MHEIGVDPLVDDADARLVDLRVLRALPFGRGLAPIRRIEAQQVDRVAGPEARRLEGCLSSVSIPSWMTLMRDWWISGYCARCHSRGVWPQFAASRRSRLIVLRVRRRVGSRVA